MKSTYELLHTVCFESCLCACTLVCTRYLQLACMCVWVDKVCSVKSFVMRSPSFIHTCLQVFARKCFSTYSYAYITSYIICAIIQLGTSLIFIYCNMANCIMTEHTQKLWNLYLYIFDFNMLNTSNLGFLYLSLKCCQR